MSEPRLPRGATWYALWALPVLVLLALLIVPWSEKPMPIFDGEKMKLAAERWQRGVAARREAERVGVAAPAAPASSGAAVPVRIVPASGAR